jgi:mitotic spindle assembly checkpoint protein MAD1
LRDELTQLRITAEKRGATLEELQSQFDELSASQDTLMRRVSEEENMGVVREELHRQANYLRTLESTNTKLTSELSVLRERQMSVEVLKEEKRGLEKKVQVLEEFRTKVVRLEAEVEAGRREREEWYLFLLHSLAFAATHIFQGE